MLETMVSQVRSAVLLGIDASPLTVEVDVSTGGLPRFEIIGLGDTAVKESRHRVQAALRSAGLWEHRTPVMVNLAPADLRKDGAALDLSIALALLLAGDRLPARTLDDVLVVGELGLEGTIRPIRGALAVASLARSAGCRAVVVPPANHHEAAAVPGIEVRSAPNLGSLVQSLTGDAPAAVPSPPPLPAQRDGSDFKDVRGQGAARRALEIAAAGGHNVLMVGPPGCGKTMLARRLPSILPPMSEAEAVEVTKVWSAAGLTQRSGLIRERPFRSPHPSTSQAGLVGGGTVLRPGEVSLAHQGVLFLDELPELPRRVLEALRQPLEDRSIVLSRARHSVRFPASFMLVAAMNPCPCGWLDHPSHPCVCAPARVVQYQQRLSGPLRDRFDLTVQTAPLETDDLFAADAPAEASAVIRARVIEARRRARARQGCINAEVGGRNLDGFRLNDDAVHTLKRAATHLSLSARSVDRVRRIARSIADLACVPRVGSDHVLEALQFREA
jgi:magnesium chelatase family protein